LGDTLERLKSRLQLYYEAETAVLSGQSYRIGTRTLQRADLAQIRQAIKELEAQIEMLERSAGRSARRVVLRDI
jgi:hypothetical protein